MKIAIAIAALLCVRAGLSQESPRKTSLAEALRLAEAHSPMLDAGRSDVATARAEAQAAGSELLPQASANGFATSGNNSGIFGSSAFPGPPTWLLVPNGTFLDGNFSLMVPILAPRAQSMARSASWQAKASLGDLAELQAELVLTVTEAYARVLLLRRVAEAEEAKASATQELVRTTQALFEAGKGIEASVQRTQAELSRAQRALTSARNDEAKALLDLDAAIGDVSLNIDPSDDLKQVETSDLLGAYLDRAKNSRGVLVAARAREEAAASDVRAAGAERLPQLSGSVMGDTSDRRNMSGVSAGLVLSFPIVDGGRINADIARAKSMEAKVSAGRRLAELNVEKEVRQAWLDVQTARTNAASAEASVRAGQSAYDVTALRVSAGKSILVEQLDALEALVRAKADLAQATFDQVLAVARLDRASGGRP